MRRSRFFLLAMVTAALALAIGFGWWTSPDAEVACGSEDVTSGCSASFDLDLSELDLLDPELAKWGLEASETGEELFVVIGSRRTEESQLVDQAVVAVFDADDGSLGRVLLDRTGLSVTVIDLVRSPDGTELALTLVVVEADGVVSNRVEIVDIATGSVVAVAEVPQGEASCEVAFLSDGSQFSCFGRIYDKASGDLIGPADDVEGFVSESRWLRIGYRTDPDVQADLTDRAASIRIRDGGREQLVSVAQTMVDTPIGDGNLSVTPTGTLIIHHRPGKEWSPWSFEGSRRAHTAAEIIAYRVADGSVERRIRLEESVVEIAWVGDRQLVTVADDFSIRVYDLG